MDVVTSEETGQGGGAAAATLYTSRSLDYVNHMRKTFCPKDMVTESGELKPT